MYGLPCIELTRYICLFQIIVAINSNYVPKVSAFIIETEESSVMYGLYFLNISYDKCMIQYFRPKADFPVSPSFPHNAVLYLQNSRNSKFRTNIQFFISKNSLLVTLFLHFPAPYLASISLLPKARGGRGP
jgi:hypothetical protein